MKIVIAGGTGYVGRALSASLAADGHETVIVSREGSGVRWDGRTPTDELAAALRGAAAAVNLAGANIGARRWTAARKREILASRVESAAALIGSVERLPAAERPAVYVSPSGADYYGDTGERPVTEADPPGTSFLAEVCVRWEQAARQAAGAGMRVAILRCGVVLGPGAEVLRRMALPYRLFAGGPLGGGRQWLSWIQLDDAVRLYRWAIDGRFSGPLNATSPDPRPLGEVGRQIGRILGRPHWLPAPAFAMRLALGEQADLLLHGRRALPEVARSLAYEFRHPDLEDALRVSLRPAPPPL